MAIDMHHSTVYNRFGWPTVYCEITPNSLRWVVMSIDGYTCVYVVVAAISIDRQTFWSIVQTISIAVAFPAYFVQDNGHL